MIHMTNSIDPFNSFSKAYHLCNMRNVCCLFANPTLTGILFRSRFINAQLILQINVLREHRMRYSVVCKLCSTGVTWSAAHEGIHRTAGYTPG